MTELHDACKSGDLRKVTSLLNNKGRDINALNTDGESPLHISCEYGHLEIVKVLLKNEKCNLNTKNVYGNTPLHLACYKKLLHIIRVLLERRCRTNIPNKQVVLAQCIRLNECGDCLLHIACQWGDVDIVRHLTIYQKCDLNIQNTHLNTPLHLACYMKNITIIRHFLEMRCSTNIPNKKGETAQDIPLNEDGDCLLHIACQWGDVGIVRYLITDEKCHPNVRVSTSENTPLHIAAKYGQDDAIVELLSYKKCNPNVQNRDGDTPLHLAASWNKTAVVSKLLAHQQIDINAQNKKGNKPLHLACYKRSLDVVKLFLKMRYSTNISNKKGETAQNIPLNEDGDCLLHIACQWGDVDIVKYLITNERCDLNVQSSTSGNTPLHIAAKYGQDDTIVELLSCKKCHSNAQNKKGDTPLHFAVRQNKIAAISQLLAHQQCNPNVKNRDGDAPLHFAAKYGQGDTMAELLSCKKCDPSVQNKEGDTPLHLAAIWNNTAVISKLLAHQQCDTIAQDKKGNTPLHLACYKRSLDVVKLFLEMRCSTNISNKKGETAQDIPLNEDGDCLLHIVCQWGDVDIVKYLITNERCDLNVQSSTSGNTPLHIAAKYGQDDTIVELLSCKKCHSNAQNKKGDTPLHFAVRQNKIAAISQLLAHQQCNPNVKNRDGDAPLHIAAKYGQGDTMAELLSCKKCDPSVQNKEGDTPLHLAVRQNKTAAISLLLAHKQCSMYVQNRKGDAPLHIACYKKSLGIIKLFLTKRCSTKIPNMKGETARDIPLNEDGDCLLHIACQWGDVDIVKYLINDEKCNPNVQSSTSKNTPLHITTIWNNIVAISMLVAHPQCNINAQNKKGDTPLHFAVRQNKIAAISQLLAHQQCNPNVKNRDGDAPLHFSAKYGQGDTMAELLSCKKCNPNAQNKDGDTPLHLAASSNKPAVVSKLLAHRQIDVNAQNKKGNTPLHMACYRKSLDIIKLLLERKCSINIPNKKGETAQDIPLNEGGDCLLHIACQWGDVDIVKYLITDERCDPNVLNKDHLTPLLTAIKHNNPTVATALLQHSKSDPTLCDPHGNTPLHLACIGGETQPEMVELAKQLLTFVDPSCVNSAGQTPIELTTNYQLIQAISHMVQCKTKQSVQTYINMFIVGNPETGKSTLVKAICKETTSILWKIVPKQVRRVKNVPLHTAGIIPTTFRSRRFGNTVLYDLAGQVEYYTSHAAVIRSTVISTPPAFIVVVNLSESEEKISQTLRYWWSFIDNHAGQSSAPPEVILVGSHADVVKSTGRSVQEKMTQLSTLLKKLPASFHFTGQVALDCRDPASKNLRLFCSLVNQSCTVLREKADVDLRCHVLYAFLQDRFKDKVACTVSNVAACVKENRELLPQASFNLIPLISTLSDKGLLFLVKGCESHGGWWIILQKQALLGEINGTIFAPKGFSQHKDLSWSTGVVPFSKLKNEFPDHNPNMVSGFLTHLEFCFKVEDHETLALLKNEPADMEDNYRDVSEEYYFFPALVSVENPLHVWEKNDDMCCKCGWFYQCIRPDQFLTTQFLHVLILRLAFAFALKLDPGDCREDSLAVCRKCSVWKHGIAWFNRTPIETVVEVGLQYQSVIVMMRCPKGKEAECVQLRSEVIQKVLEVKDEHCKAVKMSESFIHPTDVRYPFTDNVEDGKIYSLPEIARVIAKGAANALDREGKNPIPVQHLLLFDPHSTDTSSELLRELFSEKHSMDETLRTQVLETLNSESKKYKCVHYAYHVPYEIFSSTV